MEAVMSPPIDLLATARELSARFAQTASDRDRDRRVPAEEIDEIRRSGLTLLFVPQDKGGIGGTAGDFARIAEILAQGDPSIAQLFLVHCFFSRHLLAGVSGDAYDEWCRRLVEERIFVGNAASEIGGKTSMDLQTVLTYGADGAGVINGKKFYATGSRPSNVIGVLAVEGEPGSEDAQVRTVFVDADAPGMTIHNDWVGMGQRTTSSGTVELDNVAVAPGSAVDASVFEEPDSPLGLQAQAGFASIYSGIATAAMRTAVTWARTKLRPSAPSGVDRATEDPYTLLRIGELSTLTSSAQAMVERMATALDVFESDPTVENRALAAIAVSECKAHTGNVALEVSSGIFHIAGASASVEKYNLSRFWRDARTLTIHDPVDYKYKLIGDFLLNDQMPAAGAYS